MAVCIEKEVMGYTRDNNSAAVITSQKTSESLNLAKQVVELGIPTNTVAYPLLNEALDDAQAPALLTSSLVNRNQALLGASTTDQSPRVNKLLSEDNVTALKREKKLIEKESKLKTQEVEYKEDLEFLGIKYEKEHNEKVIKILKWAGIGVGGVALAGAFLYFSGPLTAAFPIISKISGAVPTKFLDNKISGIGKTLLQLKTLKLDRNGDGKVNAGDVIEMIKNNLRKAEDVKDNEFISSRINKLKK